MSTINRRGFVKGIFATSTIALSALSLHGQTSKSKVLKHVKDEVEILTGKVFNLIIDYSVVNFTGKDVIATTINNSITAPTLIWEEGDEIIINVTNNLNEDTSIHWHGIILPFKMDGVPGISFDGIKPGETFTYKFKVQQTGTYWYHSHSGFQEQTGMYGAIVIKSKEKEYYSYDNDYVITLSDWSDENPNSIYRKLKLMSDYYNFNQRTASDFFSEVKEKGFFEAFSQRKMWNEMNMMDRDISDVTGYTYTYLLNGKSSKNKWKKLFSEGERIRLRFINAAAMTFFDVRIPGLKMTVVSTDGNDVKPVIVDEFRIGVAETYDVIVEPSEYKAYAIFAQSIDRSGYALGVLTCDESLKVDIPYMDKPQSLEHKDMGMAHSDHTSMDMNNNMAMDHSSMDMQNMDHSMHMQHMDHSSMDMSNNDDKKWPITTLPFKEGIQTTMKVENPQYRLNDPGVGLRNNGRRVLTYADLRNIYSTKHDPIPNREIVLHLTGNMERYMWSINGIKHADSEPLLFKYGERLRITFVNDTMMNHPMHLHGMWSDLETGDNDFLVRKHTVIVQPGSKISFRVTVDAKGAWAFHCHLIYHMPGMFRTVVVK